jgi:hypothetical protein
MRSAAARQHGRRPAAGDGGSAFIPGNALACPLIRFERT